MFLVIKLTIKLDILLATKNLVDAKYI